jgi:hypothetical protein
MKIDLDEAIKNAAKKIDQNLPKSDWAMVLHNLMFHIPDTIKRWGPTRGYWCFPFERSVDHGCDAVDELLTLHSIWIVLVVVRLDSLVNCLIPSKVVNILK